MTKQQTDIKIQRSNGKGKYGKTSYYVRPIYDCLNRSRKVSGFTHQEIEEKMNRLIETWYAPKVVMYEVGGVRIGSNTKDNALREYWRICELADIKKPFEVKVIEP